MKKSGIIFLVVVGILLVMFLVARITGTLQFYKVATASNEPGLSVGETFFTTNLTEAESYKYATFSSKYHDSVMSSFDEKYKKGASFIYRICGMPGDNLEMKKGVLFVNQKNFDELLDLKKEYIISKNDFQLLDEEDIPVTGDAAYEFRNINDSFIVTFGKSLYKKYSLKITLTPYFINDIAFAGDCFKWYNDTLKWTPDNFGPLKVPVNSYFLLGDNRHNAMDSRFCGFVKKENITGFVINK